ncbi:MAG: hypothetical protein A3F84_04125 [Candidatus Handelsmanbacteria bacterium RIFCSPLOWO2_12_FULL_64_10]|uniref:Uncharacterized protein n=1 Tax=Handelsmanbacteria sp. (strain RIFCSPLOWO2_12_FULL_64_10) TaxID=1817868 RepID=A0A1F6CT15_HANXR|nr:MAG: hypothetical protein A3F84_04125 [Candidatus Handelsmanbacteria bacterium RIFCSPLOWO2_12_FULL_64_10]
MRRTTLFLFLLLSALLFGAPFSASAQVGGFLQTATPAESIRVEVLQVDDFLTSDSLFAVARRPIETGWKATVQGTISYRDYQVFVLVHALLSDTWIVQSAVARPSKTGTWRTTCYFGAERKGQDEDYEIIAVAYLKRDQFRTGQRIPANQFPPADIPQSDTVLIRRVRSPSP